MVNFPLKRMKQDHLYKEKEMAPQDCKSSLCSTVLIQSQGHQFESHEEIKIHLHAVGTSNFLHSSA